MPYGLSFDAPRKDDVIWGNDSILPPYKRFDTANPSDPTPCNFGDDSHQDVSVAYRYDPEVGWLLCCYSHAMEALDSDTNHPFSPGAPKEEEAPRPSARQALADKKKVPETAVCDQPHDELADAPKAVVGVFQTLASKKDGPPKFLCMPCALMFVSHQLIKGSFDPFEMIGTTK